MDEASSSSNRQANDRTNVQNQREIEEGQSSRGDDKYRRHLDLYKLIQLNNWQRVKEFVDGNPDDLKEDNLLGRSMTILHLIMSLLVDAESDKEATELIKKLAPSMDLSNILGWQDNAGNTVLSFCAIRGNLEASEFLVNYKPDLLKKRTRQNNLPVHLAAFHGHKGTFDYLLKKTPGLVTNFYRGGDGGKVLSYLIEADLYDEAFKLLKNHPEIVHEFDSQKMILESLALKPDAFESGSGLGCFERFIYKYMPVNKELASIQTNDNPNVVEDIENPIGTTNSHSEESILYGSTQQITTFDAQWPYFKAIYAQKLTHMRAVEIVRFICENVAWTKRHNREKSMKALFTATRLGIPEFVNEFIMSYNYCSLLLNPQGHGIFDLAVLHRREKVFNLIRGVNCSYFFMSLNDNSGNNILHLTGKSEPSSHVPAGAALKMQRELQWFKVVENLVHPRFRAAENKQGKTPREVFTEEHEELVKQGEKWMRDTTSSCSVVAALIITVTFAAALNVPGGRDNRGIPNFLDQPSFMVFAISDALALFSSIASVITFLSILTSSYSEEDFLWLPTRLIFGNVALLFSLISMAVAFVATVQISLSHKWNLVYIPTAVVGSVLILLFVCLQSRPLGDMWPSGRDVLIKGSWRELNSGKRVAKGKCKKRVKKPIKCGYCSPV